METMLRNDIPERPEPLMTRSGTPARSLWNLDPQILHLNHGSFGAVPHATLERRIELQRETEAAPVKWFVHVYERLETARRHVAAWLHTNPDTMAFVPNASAGASAVEHALRFGPGDEIVVTDHGYGAVVMGAEFRAMQTGASIVRVHIPLGTSDDDIVARIAAALGEHTRLVIVDQITSATATLFPAQRIAQLVHDRSNARVLVDGAHAPGLIEDDPAAIGADYWIGNLHKFACAPRGCAVLIAGSKTLADELHPLIDSWNPQGPFGPRFNEQGTLDYTSFITAPISYDTLDRELGGWPVIRDYVNRLADYGQYVVADAFAHHTGRDHMVSLPNPAPAMRLVRLPAPLGCDHDSSDGLRRPMLEQGNAECAFTCFDGKGYLRLSSHAYNTAADYEEFAKRCVPLLMEWSRS